MTKTIIYDGTTAWSGTSGKPINIYYDGKTWPTTSLNGKNRTFGATWNSLNRAVTSTGYYCALRWDGNYLGTSYQVTEPLIRLAEVYLNYAEATNEAFGPTGTAGGQGLTALERRAFNAGHIVGNLYRSQAQATIESATSDAGHAVGDLHGS